MKVALFGGGRFLHAPTSGAPVHLGAFLSDALVTVSIERVEAFLEALSPLEIDPRYFRLLFRVTRRP